MKKEKKSGIPPSFAQWLICRFLRKRDQGIILGDFAELFSDAYEKKGSFQAKLWYWGHLFKSIPGFVFNRLRWSLAMIRNYLKVSVRNMKRHKTYSFINILGLGTGWTCAIFIFLWVADELSFDRFHENISSLYRVETNKHLDGKIFHSALTPSPLGSRLEAEIPEIVKATRYEHIEEMLARYEDRAFYENDIWAVDPAFFEMFSFLFLRGDTSAALNGPYSVVMTENTAKKYFDDRDPVGQTMSFNNQYEFTVTGVLRNIPHNSSLRFRMLVSCEFLEAIGIAGDNFLFFSGQTFVQLNDNAVAQQVNDKIAGFLKSHNKKSLAELELMPVAGIHLHSYSGLENTPGDVQYVYFFSLIAVFVLMIACINFMNLSTARSTNRAKEIGMRKVVGAGRKDIVKQFYSESFFQVVVAQLFALLLVGFLLPAFNNLVGKELALDLFFNPTILLGFVVIIMITAFIAGSYPAIYLSSFQPLKILCRHQRMGSQGSSFRKLLVLVQFTLSIILIIGTVVVYRQLDYMRNKNLGYDKELLIYVPLRGETRHSYLSMKKELENKSGILGITGSGSIPSSIHSQYLGAEWDGKSPDQEIQIGVNAVDFNFVETLGIGLKEGRSFSKDNPEDIQGSWIVNEELVRIMGVKSAVGMNYSHMGIRGRIVGVINNFRFRSARERTVPLALTVFHERLFFMLVRLQADNLSAAFGHLGRTWKNLNPDYPLDFRFLNEDFGSIYRSEEKMGNILGYFSLLAVSIAGLGLFGLSSYVAEQRTKEIGIRKVLGASEFDIISLLSKEYSKWILLANIIAWPVGWYVMHQWLDHFAHRTDLNLWLFILAGGFSFIIAILSISFQSIKAAGTDPVTSLRYE